MKIIKCLITVLFLLAVGNGGINTVTAKSLYDDFSGNYLDSSKWDDREFVREIANGKLVSISRAESGGSRNRTTFRNSESIFAIQAAVTPVASSIGSGSNVVSKIRLDGQFFNSQPAGGETGDVWAAIRIEDDGNGLESNYVVVEALDDNWDTWNVWAEDTISTGLSYGQTYNLKIEYNEGAHEFTFTLNGVAPITVTAANLPNNLRAAVRPNKHLTTGFDDAESGVNIIHAQFDNIKINNQDTVYDDFSNSPLDQTKWQSLEFVRELSNGKLRANVHADGEREDVDTKPDDQDTAYFEAKVLIESGSQISSGASGHARIAGWYYNDSRGSGSGQDYNGNEGDVWVSNRIRLDDSSNLEARCWVWRSDTFDSWDSNAPNIFEQEFTTAINFDTEYTLSIEFTGSTIIFKCNNETYQYNITSSVYPPSGQYRVLESRIYADPGESGYLKTNFDDVYTGESSGEGGGSGGGGGGGGGGCFIKMLNQ